MCPRVALPITRPSVLNRHHVRAAAAANGATTVPPVRNAEHLKRHDVRIRFRPPDPDRAKPRPIRQPPQRDRPKFSLLRVIRLPTGSLRVWRAPEATSPACQSSRPISLPSDWKPHSPDSALNFGAAFAIQI